MHKCVICGGFIKFTEIRHIIFKQYKCNNCLLLFNYDCKNVRIKYVNLRVMYLKHHTYLKSFVDDDLKEALRYYLLKKYRWKRSKTIFFYRDNLRQVLSKINFNRRKVILLIEIL